MSCTLTIDVPIVSDQGTHRGDLRAASGRIGQIPAGARVKLRCGRATYFLDYEAPMLAQHLRNASAVEIESEDSVFAVSLYRALSDIWSAGAI